MPTHDTSVESTKTMAESVTGSHSGRPLPAAGQGLAALSPGDDRPDWHQKKAALSALPVAFAECPISPDSPDCFALNATCRSAGTHSHRVEDHLRDSSSARLTRTGKFQAEHGRPRLVRSCGGIPGERMMDCQRNRYSG